MTGSFVENINLLASKLPIIEESNEIFDEDVVPILREISQLDIGAAIADLKKGNYLGNRKLDINLILNMLNVDEALLERDPDLAEAIWTDVNKAVHYDKAFITFVDGVEIELPFMFDGSPVTVTTHGDLLAQFARLDYVYAKAQIDSIYQVTVGNSTDYTVTIDATPYTFTSDIAATRENIIAGIANMINSAAVPVTALVTDNGTKLSLTAKVPGNPFYASVSNNMAINTIQVNVIEGPVETAFLAKLENTLAANFAEPIVGEIVRLYDVIGFNSNVERIRLNAVSGSYKTQAPEYYWANTTSAFQTLSMRANDIIKLGAEIDNIILLAKSIEEVIEIQKRLPQLVDTFDGNNNPNGDETIYNHLSELVDVHSKLGELITVYNDIKVGGTNYVQSIGQDLQGSNTIGVVASDLQLGVDSNINITGSNIDKVITVSDNIDSVNTVATANTKIDLIVDTVIPNLPEILLADDNAIVATNKALEATEAAAIATAKNNEMKNVSVGTTITGIPGTPANVTYNPISSKFTFVIPKGDKGEKGDAFQVNAIGLKASQSLYDSMIEGFSFLALDESLIYFKMSNTPGDWSLGSPFGKGDKGDKGDTGNSIVNTVFTSTTDPSGLAGQSGATDTYTINYDNLETDTFTVKNGEDGLDNIIDTVIGVETTWSSTKIKNELDLKAVKSVTYTKTEVDTKIATGNSATATKLQTARTINGVSFDGSANITVSDSTAVKLTGNQTIAGVKTFSSSPIVPTPTTEDDAVNKDYVDVEVTSANIYTDTRVNQVAGHLNTDYYQGPYGINWDYATDTYIRTGAKGFTAIQSLMRRCVLNSDGSVNYYLNPNNSNFKEDGTPSVLTGADGNVMVEIPKHYIKDETAGSVDSLSVSLTLEPGYVLDPSFLKWNGTEMVEVPYRYYRAYEGFVSGGKLRSVSGVTPTRSQTISVFRGQAMANGDGWHLTDWNLLNTIKRLCYIEFCDFIVTKYLGEGNHAGSDYGITTGQSNSLGNRSSNSTHNDKYMSYRGIENMYADIWEFVDGVNVNNYQFYVNGNYSTFQSDVFTGDYIAKGPLTVAANYSLIKRCAVSSDGGFIPTVVGGSTTTFYGDALWSATGSRIAFYGGYADFGASAGLGTLGVAYASSASTVGIGAAVCR